MRRFVGQSTSKNPVEGSAEGRSSRKHIFVAQQELLEMANRRRAAFLSVVLGQSERGFGNYGGRVGAQDMNSLGSAHVSSVGEVQASTEYYSSNTPFRFEGNCGMAKVDRAVTTSFERVSPRKTTDRFAPIRPRSADKDQLGVSRRSREIVVVESARPAALGRPMAPCDVCCLSLPMICASTGITQHRWE